MAEASDNIEKQAMMSQERLDSFKESLYGMIENVGKIRQDSKVVSQELFTNMAKLDHMIYKNNAYNAALKMQADTNLVSDANNCRLGKWYNEEGRKEFGNSQAYKDLQVPHKTIHENISKAMSLYTSADVLDSQEIIRLFKESESESLKLFAYLDKMVQEQ